jgi:hypothetical protein
MPLSWFCKKDGLAPVVSMGAYDAGYVIAKTKPELREAIVPVADGLLQTLEKGTSQEVANNIFAEAIHVLISKIEDQFIAANIASVLSQVNFTVGDKAGQGLSTEVIGGLVTAFLSGMKAVR